MGLSSPAIRFDVDEDVELPRSRGSYFCAQEGVTLVCQFVEQYYQLCDSDDREPLIRAYHPEAMFSVTSVCPPRPRRSSTAPPK
jgi:nuclear RNA export factor